MNESVRRRLRLASFLLFLPCLGGLICAGCLDGIFSNPETPAFPRRAQILGAYALSQPTRQEMSRHGLLAVGEGTFALKADGTIETTGSLAVFLDGHETLLVCAVIPDSTVSGHWWIQDSYVHLQWKVNKNGTPETVASALNATEDAKGIQLRVIHEAAGYNPPLSRVD